MPGAKGHLNEEPQEILGEVTLSPELSHRLETERERRRRRQARRQEAHRFRRHRR